MSGRGDWATRNDGVDTMVDREMCGNCRFWHPTWKFRKEQSYAQGNARLDVTNPRDTGGLRKHSNKGLCRRYAPQASALTTVWMETSNSDWCGDHERIRQEPDDPED